MTEIDTSSIIAIGTAISAVITALVGLIGVKAGKKSVEKKYVKKVPTKDSNGGDVSIKVDIGEVWKEQVRLTEAMKTMNFSLNTICRKIDSLKESIDEKDRLYEKRFDISENRISQLEAVVPLQVQPRR